MPGVNVDERRSAALLLWPQQQGARVDPAPELLDPFRDRGTRSRPRRFLEALLIKRERMGWESHVVKPLMDARRAALGGEAGGPPRVLLRVDEFPHARAFDSAGPFGTDNFKRFHAVLAEAGIPYLLAITPRVSRDYLDPTVTESRPLDDAELAQLQALRDEGVMFGLHGLDHRTRHASPRRHSELCGLGADALGRRLDAARRTFDDLGLPTPVFVPPFNRFDASQYRQLARRFEVVCGGPESVQLLGFDITPAWRGDAVYLPSYPPLYGHAVEVATGVERLAELEAALWAPATLHWGWETRDGFDSLRRLCRTLAGRTATWPEFLAAVESSRVA
jgi:peptidoglycan/xylan/chitin deacetylase (PgdA/CDA1 family)